MKSKKRSSKLEIIIPIKNKQQEKRTAIPKALREQVWRTHIGSKYESKCTIVWCTNKITPFDYEVGHNIPHSKGGSSTIDNLRPICSRCNKSMSNTYTIDEWNDLGNSSKESETSIAVTTSCCWSCK